MPLPTNSSESKAPAGGAVRLVVAVVVINLMALALVGLSLRETRRDCEERARIEARNLAELLDHDISALIKKIDLALLTVTDEIDRERADGSVSATELNPFVGRLLGRLPELEGLRMADEQGELRYGSGLERKKGNVADRDYFLRLKEDSAAGLVFSRPLVGRITGKWTLNLARRLNHRDGTFAGIVYGTIPLTHFVKHFSTIGVGKNGDISLRDGEMGIIARFPEPRGVGSMAGNRTLSPEMKRHLEAGRRSGTFLTRRGRDSAPKVVSYHAVGNYPLFVNVGLARRDYLARWWGDVSQMSAVLGLFSLTTILMARLLVTKWRQEALTQQELRSAKEELELRVLERTEALRGANERLREELEQRLRTKQALRQSEQMLRDITTNIGEGIFVFDRQGLISFVNSEAERLLGWSEAELKGRRSYEAIHHLPPDSTGLASEPSPLKRVLLTGDRCVSRDELFVRKDGTLFPVDLIATPILEQGAVVASVVAFSDSTEAKQAAESIRKLSLAVEQSPLSILITDHRGRIEYVNRRFTQQTGYSAEEAVGNSPKLLQSGLTPDQTYQELWETVRSGAVWEKELLNRKKDGEIFWAHVTVAPILDTAGAITHFVAMEADTTELKQAEQRQLLSERRFRAVLENISLLSVLLDREGRVVFCNDCLLELSGWKREEVLGGDWFGRFLPAEVRAKTRAVFDAAIGSGHPPPRRDSCLMTRDGAIRSVTWNITLLQDTDDAVSGLACLGIDTTEQKSLEEQLMQAQKMDAVGQLAGGVAHDFNNLLTVIIGYCEMLRLTAEPTSQQLYQIEQIAAAADRAAHLTGSLLAFSRKQSLERQRCDLNALVSNVHGLLRRLIGEDIRLTLTPSPAPLSGEVDPGQIEQVLVNLAANARDAMPRGGTLTIATDSVELDASFEKAHGYGTPGRYARITVADTGVGMDEATRKRVYEPFFTTKALGKGTGLGMSIVYGIVKQHQGFINVYSEPGHGTTFRIYLPVGQPQPAEEEALAAPLPEKGSETILVVEDEPLVQNVVCQLLTNYGYTVLVAGDGEEGVATFARHADQVRLVLMDIIMPKMNGKEASERIRALDPKMKVLFTSGYTADIIESRVELDHKIDIVMKPVQPMELLGKLREMLDAPA